MHAHFWAYLHEGSTDKHQEYIKQRGLQPGRILLTKNLEEHALKDPKFQKFPNGEIPAR
jgi:hypothetical protein